MASDFASKANVLALSTKSSMQQIVPAVKGQVDWVKEHLSAILERVKTEPRLALIVGCAAGLTTGATFLWMYKYIRGPQENYGPEVNDLLEVVKTTHQTHERLITQKNKEIDELRTKLEVSNTARKDKQVYSPPPKQPAHYRRGAATSPSPKDPGWKKANKSKAQVSDKDMLRRAKNLTPTKSESSKGSLGTVSTMSASGTPSRGTPTSSSTYADIATP